MKANELLKDRREDILRLAAQHGAHQKVRVFGSAARGDAGPDSDFDFLVEFEEGRSLLDVTALWQDLEELLGRKVIKLDRLGKNVRAIKVTQGRSEKRWKRTEERIRALLARAKTTERRIAASRWRSLPLRKTAVDRRLKALADLVERQIRERRNRKA